MAEPPFLFVAAMDVEAEREDLFNDVYDAEHVPNLRAVPGVLSITRYRRVPLRIAIGGAVRDVETVGEPAYAALYGVSSPDVLVSSEWAAAIEQGRWPAEVRPVTRNRHHTLFERIVPRREGP